MASPNTLFVGNLSWGIEDMQLNDAFARFNCISAQVQRHDDSGRSKGWGLVTLGSAADVAEAIGEMSGFELDGRSLVVREDRGATEKSARPKRERKPRERKPRTEAKPSPKLYFGNLSWSVTSDMLNELMSSFNVESAEIAMGRNERSRGYGLVNAGSIENAENIIAKFNETEYEGRRMFVRFENEAA